MSTYVPKTGDVEPWRDWLPILLLVLISGVTCFLYLNRGALYYDEAIYAQVATEIIETNDWITLHWNGQPWFHKPPLYFWITALLFETLGPGEFSARVLSAFSGVGCVALTYVIGKRLYSRSVGVIAGLILLTSALFVVNARRGMIDVLMTFFVLLGVWAYLRSTASANNWIVVGVACGLAVLTKGAAGLIAPAIIGVSLLFDGRLSDLRSKPFWLGVGVFIALVASWHCMMIALHGSSFLNTYLLKHIVERSISDLHHYNFGPGFYFFVTWSFLWPWVVAIPLALIVGMVNNQARAITVQAVLPFVLFSIATTKFSWYIVPIIPALAILVASLFQLALERLRPKLRVLVWLTLVLFFTVGTLQVIQHSKPNREMQAVAGLAKLAAKDQGAISSSPETLEMTVRYYSKRQLCVDPVVSPLSFDGITKCPDGQIRHFIFRSDNRAIVESRFGPIRAIAESQGIVYGEVSPLK